MERIAVKSFFRARLCSVVAAAAVHVSASSFANAAETNSLKPTVIVMVGAAGEEDFGKVFIESAAAWQKAAEKAGANFTQIGGSDAQATNDLAEFRLALGREAKTNATELWLVLLGHGTFDGKEAKFNLRGQDLTAGELADWVQPTTTALPAASTAMPLAYSAETPPR